MEPTVVEKTSSSKVILSIIIILVVAAIAFAMMRGNEGQNDEMGTTTNATTSDEAMEGGSFSGNIFTLVSRGGDWKCTWTSEQDGVELDGTVYVSRGKFKSDVEMTGAGMNAVAHALGDGQFVYSWSSLLATGIKFPMQDGATGVAVSGTNAQNAQFAKDYNYDCDPWKADLGTFALPSGITFTETAAAGTQQ
jgi:hypothetical protein